VQLSFASSDLTITISDLCAHIYYNKQYHFYIVKLTTNLTVNYLYTLPSIINMSYRCYLPPTTEEVNAIDRDVCLSVCLLARLLKNVCMDFDDILRVDGCRDMDELINF